MQIEIDLKEVKLINGSTLIGALVNDGIIGKNFITLGDPTEIIIKDNDLKMKRCLPFKRGLQWFDIPTVMIEKITDPNDDIFQLYHDQIMTETVLRNPQLH